MEKEHEKEPLFMNLHSDYAFKQVFGSEQNKSITIQFLNALFEGEFVVNDLCFHDKEVLPSEEEGKRILYDVYCTHVGNKAGEATAADDESTIGKGEHFIIEMQNSYEPLWESRAIGYTAAAVYHQFRRGEEYTFAPVFSIFVMDFSLSGMSRRLKHDIRFADIETHERLSDDVRLLFLSLKEVKKKWEECTTELERLLFLIKNMHKMDKESTPYQEKNYYKLFHASEMPPRCSEEYVYYSQSVLKMKENQRAVDYAAKKARAEGMAEGIEKGIEKGMAEGIEKGIEKGERMAKQQTAINLYKAGIGIDLICAATGLDQHSVKSLIDSIG